MTPSIQRILTFGRRVPAALGGLVLAAAGATLLGHAPVGQGHLGDHLVLLPAAVLQGEIWRLVTWAFVEGDLLGLAMALLTLWGLGRELCFAWGPRRFLATWVVLGLATGLAVTGLSLIWPVAGLARAGGVWPLTLALLVAWGTIFPERQLLLFFALPLRAGQLSWIVLGGTALWLVAVSATAALPAAVAEALMVAWVRGWGPRALWQEVRLRLGQWRMRRRSRHLRVVKKNGADGPPRYLN